MTIMHKNCMDVAFEVLSTHFYKPGRRTLKGYWVNLGYMGKPWYLTYKTKIDIKEQDWSNWVDITDQVNQVRYKSGLPYKE